eukprot:5438218-Prymnesium_polylepis.1
MDQSTSRLDVSTPSTDWVDPLGGSVQPIVDQSTIQRLDQSPASWIDPMAWIGAVGSGLIHW